MIVLVLAFANVSMCQLWAVFDKNEKSVRKNNVCRPTRCAKSEIILISYRHYYCKCVISKLCQTKLKLPLNGIIFIISTFLWKIPVIKCTNNDQNSTYFQQLALANFCLSECRNARTIWTSENRIEAFYHSNATCFLSLSLVDICFFVC